MSTIRRIRGGVLAPKGFRGAAVACGLKSTKGALDLAIITSDIPASAAAVFTRNRLAAAAVQLDRRRMRRGRLQAIVVNAGNANACTGPGGLADAEAMAAETAAALGLQPADVAVASTGVIGHRLPMAKVLAGIRAAGRTLAPGLAAAGRVAKAIMTTDTVPKAAAVSVRIAGREVRVGGTVKGAGMIAPNMATMLAFLTTDAAVAPDALRGVLRDVVDRTFNRITVDGDSSTNDSVFLLANGAAGNPTLKPADAGLAMFRAAIFAVADSLAEQMVLDAEGATKFVEVRVEGAATARDAERAARAIAESVLLKCALYGNDPNWGRIACAAGYSGARFKPADFAIDISGIPVVRGGTPAGARQAALVKAVMRGRIAIRVGLGAGKHEARFRTCDLSHEYVDINARYHT